MYKKVNVLLHPFFLTGLLVLLLNDHVLKQAYHNNLTGKLSDFAGLFIFPLFWCAFFPKYKKGIYIATAIIFTLWKSSVSQPFVDWLHLLHIPLDRVVDYGDLIALIILPLSYLFFNTAKPHYGKSVMVTPIAIVSFLAFCATSLPSPTMKYLTDDVGMQMGSMQSFETMLSREQVLQKLDNKGFTYGIDTVCHRRNGKLNTPHSNHDTTCVTNEFFTINNLVVDNDTLLDVYLAYKNRETNNVIYVYGFTTPDKDAFEVDDDTFLNLHKKYRDMIEKGLIAEIIE